MRANDVSPAEGIWRLRGAAITADLFPSGSRLWFQESEENGWTRPRSTLAMHRTSQKFQFVTLFDCKSTILRLE